MNGNQPQVEMHRKYFFVAEIGDLDFWELFFEREIEVHAARASMPAKYCCLDIVRGVDESVIGAEFRRDLYREKAPNRFLGMIEEDRMLEGEINEIVEANKRKS